MTRALAANSSPPREAHVPAARWELLQALGALTALSPPASRSISQALELAEWTRAEHTRLFVLELPPYASIHLGSEGKLGGDGADRVAGLWRALGLGPPTDADHLASLLALYAELGHAAETCATESARRRLDHARTVLLHEYLQSWMPGYLTAVAAYPAGADWSRLIFHALRQEVEHTPPSTFLPAALRDAPAMIDPTVGYDDLLDALTVPLRTGFLLTPTDLTRAGREIGTGIRRGERRYALRAMLEQDPNGTVHWLAGHARRWAAAHRSRQLDGPTAAWWERRAEGTAAVLDGLGAPRA